MKRTRINVLAVAVMLLLLVVTAIVGSANNGEGVGNPHTDDNVTIYVYPEVIVHHNSTMDTPVVNVTVNSTVTPKQSIGNDIPWIKINNKKDDQFVITKELVNEFLRKQGYILFSEYTSYDLYPPKTDIEEVSQYWFTTTDIIKVSMYKDINGHPQLSIRSSDVLIRGEEFIEVQL